MNSNAKFFIALVLFSGTNIFVRAQSGMTNPKQPSSLHHRLPKKDSTPSIEAQIQQMREDLQGQIDELKIRLAARDEQIEVLKAQTLNTQQRGATASTKLHDIDSTPRQNTTAVNNLKTSATDLREKDVDVNNSDQMLCLLQVHEPVGVQALSAEGSVEAFHESVVSRSARP